MGDNTTTTTTQPIVQSSQPYAPSEPYINNIMSEAGRLYIQPYQQNPYGAMASLDPQVSSALGNMWGNDWNNLYQNPNSLTNIPSSVAVNQIQTGGADQFAPAANIFNQVASNGTNPFLNQLLDANAERIGNQVASRFSGAGRYGSSGFVDALNRSIAETNNPILFQSAEGQANRQLQAGQGLGNIAQNITGNQRAWAGMAPQLAQLQQMPLQDALNIGNYYQQRAQAEQALASQKWQEAYMAPWTQLGRYQGGITNLAGILSGARTQTTSPQVATQSQPTPWTSLAGLGIAGLGALSDVRKKTNIVYLGEELGLSIYEYSYKADHNGRRYRGPMAQDVLLKYPKLVTNVGGDLYLTAN